MIQVLYHSITDDLGHSLNNGCMLTSWLLLLLLLLLLEMLMILVQDLLPVISEDLGLALGLSILQNWGPLDDLLENLPVKTHPSAQALNQCQAVKA
jgi:hypothetical protein